MFVETHIIQNFAPSNLNRDDTGSPKSCEFGGYRRARISSQCIKRAIRQQFKNENLIPEDARAVRTKRLVDEVSNRLAHNGRNQDEARRVVEVLLAGVQITIGSDGKSQYLLSLAPEEIAVTASLCETHWDALLKVSRPDSSRAPNKAEAARAVPNEAKRALESALDGGRAADLALFGRMLADIPDKNIDAASQVAHAISTHEVNLEFDYYTAVDDLNPEDTSGAGMIGTIEFNSACFYRYSNVDLNQLRENLGGDTELTAAALRAFIQGSVDAVPSGKQHTFAAQNAPALVFTVVRDSGLWSLANAFVRPVRPNRGEDVDLVQRSVAVLGHHWAKLADMYGDESILGAWVATTEAEQLNGLSKYRVDRLKNLVDQTVSAVNSRLSGGA